MDNIEKENYFKNRALYERPRCDDEVISIIEDMPYIEPGTSAIRVDLTSVETPIHMGMSVLTHNSPRTTNCVLSDYYIHNPVTGQRQMIKSMPRTPRPKKLLYIGDGNFVNDTVYCVQQNNRDFTGRQSQYAPDGCVYELDGKTISLPNDDSPMWFIHNGIGILIEKGVLGSEKALINYHAGDYVCDEKITSALKLMKKFMHFDDFKKFL